MSNEEHEKLKRRLNLIVDVDLANKTAEARRLAAKKEKKLKEAIELTGDETVLIGVAQPYRLQLPAWPSVIGTTDGDETQPFVDTPTAQNNYKNLLHDVLRSDNKEPHPLEDTKPTGQTTIARDAREKTKKRKYTKTRSKVRQSSAYTRNVSFSYADQNQSLSEPATKSIKLSDEPTRTEEIETDKCIIS